MSNIALSWAYKCHVGNAPAKAVLVYLADRASDDGTAAFPKIDTIVAVTEFSESSVRKSLRLLQERGFIRKGDQRYARIGTKGRDRLPQYCQIVWDLAVESDPATLVWIEETHRSERDPSTMGGKDPAAEIVPRNKETCELVEGNVENKPIPSTVPRTGLEKQARSAKMSNREPAPHVVHTQPCTTCSASPVPRTELPYKGLTQQANPPSFPSAPTGHLPASGATAGEHETTTGAGLPGGDGIAASVDRVLDSLSDRRSRLGLSTPEPTRADRNALNGLYRRLAVAGERRPAEAMIEAIGFATGGDWWPRRVRTGRQLAARWEELIDDMTLPAKPAVSSHPPEGSGASARPETGPKDECSAAGFSDFLLRNPQLTGDADLLWRLQATYWRNAGLGHGRAIQAITELGRAWTERPESQGVRP